MPETCKRWNDDGQAQCGANATHLLHNPGEGWKEEFCPDHTDELLGDSHNGWVWEKSVSK